MLAFDPLAVRRLTLPDDASPLEDRKEFATTDSTASLPVSVTVTEPNVNWLLTVAERELVTVAPPSARVISMNAALAEILDAEPVLAYTHNSDADITPAVWLIVPV